jgi:toxin ParE1/3/4
VPGKADYVITQFEQACASLSENPHRGAYLKEFLAIGIKEYREILFKPSRIIYRVLDDTVYILLTNDGRQDMQVVLQRQLLGGVATSVISFSCLGMVFL